MAEDEAEPQTPIRTSGTYPILRTMAEEEMSRLAKFVPESTPIIARLRSLVAILASWSPSNQPTDEDRQRLIDELWDTLKDAGKMR